MCVIFRNNAVSLERPDGIFHANPRYHFIKKEPLGLIEAQGLFILPGRLVEQLSSLEEALNKNGDLPDNLQDFKLLWDLVSDMKGKPLQAIHGRVETEIANICEHILHDLSVFPDKESLSGFIARISIV